MRFLNPYLKSMQLICGGQGNALDRRFIHLALALHGCCTVHFIMRLYILHIPHITSIVWCCRFIAYLRGLCLTILRGAVICVCSRCRRLLRCEKGGFVCFRFFVLASISLLGIRVI
jgi:hypothetical protein